MRASAGLTLVGATASDDFGFSLCGGFADVLVGARLNDVGGTDAGRVQAFFGNPLDATADGVITGGASNDWLGYDCVVRDVTGDASPTWWSRA